jgi:cytochrome b6
LVFLRGGEEVTGATLTRFFGFHVAVLPGLTTVFLVIHLVLVQRFGMSVPESVERGWAATGSKPREMPFFPNFALRDLMGWYIALGVLGALAALMPWDLGTKADAFAPAPAGIRPEWYFLFAFETLKLIPAKIWFIDGEVLGVLGFSVGALLWLLIPFLDRKPGQRWQWFFLGVGIFVVAFMVVTTTLTFLVK